MAQPRARPSRPQPAAADDGTAQGHPERPAGDGGTAKGRPCHQTSRERLSAPAPSRLGQSASRSRQGGAASLFRLALGPPGAHCVDSDDLGSTNEGLVGGCAGTIMLVCACRERQSRPRCSLWQAALPQQSRPKHRPPTPERLDKRHRPCLWA
jgi:hypothetical protein